MIRFTEEFRAIVKAARRVGTPLIAVRTADPASAITQVCEAINGKQDPPPLIVWDLIGGLQGRNEAGKSALAKVLGAKVKMTHVPDAASAIATLQGRIRPGDAILVKGSNSVGLAALVEALTAGGKG